MRLRFTRPVHDGCERLLPLFPRLSELGEGRSERADPEGDDGASEPTSSISTPLRRKPRRVTNVLAAPTAKSAAAASTTELGKSRFADGDEVGEQGDHARDDEADDRRETVWPAHRPVASRPSRADRS